MKNTTIFSAMTDENFRSKAFADYITKCAQDYTKLINLLSEAITNYDDTGMTVEERVDAILNEANLSPHLVITFKDGYTSLGALLSSMIITSDSYSQYDLVPNSDTPILEAPVLQLVDFDLSNTVSISFNEILSGIEENLQNTVCAAAAMYASYKDTVSDRITYFKEYIGNALNLSTINESPIFDFYKKLLLDTQNTAQNIGYTIYTTFGIIKRSNPNDDGVLRESQVCNYTGSTPVAAIDFSNAVDATITVVRKVGTVVAGICKGIWNFVKPVFQKVIRAVSDVINVNDITILNKDGKPSVDGWCYQDEENVKLSFTPVWDQRFVEHYEADWLKYQTIFGEILVKFDNYDLQTGKTHTVMKLKPYAINIPKAMGCLNSAGFQVTYRSDVMLWSVGKGTVTLYADFVQALQNMQSIGDELYLTDTDPNVTENNYYDGFYCGATLLEWFIRWVYEEMIYTDYPDDVDAGFNFIGPYSIYVHNDQVTNADFIKVCAGWDKNITTPTFNSGPLGKLLNVDGLGMLSSTTLAYCLFEIMMIQVQDRWSDPTNWSFLPYRNHVENFEPSRYSISTDDENQKALDKFVNIFITVVIAVVVAITCAALVRTISRKIFWKKYRAVGAIDQKIWNGQALTASERRKYIRYQRKLSLSNMLTRQVSNASEPVSSSSDTLFSLYDANITQTNSIISSNNTIIGKEQSIHNDLGTVGTNVNNIYNDLGTVATNVTNVSNKLDAIGTDITDIYNNVNTVSREINYVSSLIKSE